jgi:ribonuclease BN (tRNA processing enzyme)
VRLTTVGTGTAAPSPARVQSGHLVEAGAVRLLLDCGSGIAFRMAQLGIRWQAITHLALSHFHADHTTDLATLIYAWRYGDLPPRSEPLELIGPVGTAALLERMAAVFGPKLLAPDYPVIVREIVPGASIDLGDGVALAARKVPHTDESVAYSVERGARRLVYTGDTAMDDGLGTWAAGCDVLLAECSLPADMAIASHLTPEQCGALAALAAPRLLALTHFYPPVERVDVRAIVAARFDGPVVLTHDGWSTDIEDS